LKAAYLTFLHSFSSSDRDRQFVASNFSQAIFAQTMFAQQRSLLTLLG